MTIQFFIFSISFSLLLRESFISPRMLSDLWEHRVVGLRREIGSVRRGARGESLVLKCPGPQRPTVCV